ncbi:putative cytochrome oxidase assembly protein [Lyophyllum shimeji]|uniref:Cytochrome oxidase assembly protein n=1 Tax=Lyophyllum shimeji TaxID=47721 RepID=A0A9P3PDL3_LYOSH|nr:putative cytochrome oxidase assembly protein [Lyophyllum shimeji]
MIWGALRKAARLRPAVQSPCLRWTRPCSARAALRAVHRTAPAPLPSARFRSLLAASRSPFRTFVSSAVAPSASTPTPPPAQLPILTPRSVGIWLMISSTLVFAIVVVGGVTRLTESGLSITEWRPITGILPPLTQAEWEAEFEKYKKTPEFKMLNSSATLDDFKFIFAMEWGHRLLGRLLGVVFVAPLLYFGLRRKISRRTFYTLFGLGSLIGAQGVLGWYMVQSGLDDALLDTPGAVPRVSQYRLAAHLGMALALYAGMFGAGMAAIKDWKFSRGAGWSGMDAKACSKAIKSVLANPSVRTFKVQAWALTGLVLLTALSGAFVAGLDAGLLYNEFPLMGGRLAPPADELFSPLYAKSPDASDLWWRNIFENPTTVQFDHRVLATTTYLTTLLLWLQSRRVPLLPPLARTATTAAFAMANLQVLLGISTLLYLVPVPLAAAHQAGSVMLLSAMLHVLVTLRRPGQAARMWRQALARGKRGTGAGTEKVAS